MLDGRTYDEIAREAGVRASDARNATRMVRERVDAALARLLVDEGVPAADVPLELARIRTIIGEGRP